MKRACINLVLFFVILIALTCNIAAHSQNQWQTDTITGWAYADSLHRHFGNQTYLIKGEKL